jgi:UDPglucose 6-dehydrogenase
MKIAVVGAGYVGTATAVALAAHNQVVVLDNDHAKVNALNNMKSPFGSASIDDFLKNKPLKIRATYDKYDALFDADFVIIAVPTDYDQLTNTLDMSTIEHIIKYTSSINSRAAIIIKSTLPIGGTDTLKRNSGYENLLYTPEFLREENALHDVLHPSRIVIGGKSPKAQEFIDLLLGSIKNKKTPILSVDSKEAESIKLFSNAYLAMRIAFFNELDTFASLENMDVRHIINGVCADKRIGHYYNNPSFGYGGYCLPKDTKQLLAHYEDRPQRLMQAIVEANMLRKRFIADRIISRNLNTIGIYRLTMKKASDNFRESAIIDIINYIKDAGLKIIVYEPLITSNKNAIQGFTLVENLNHFKKISDLIVANRSDTILNDVLGKVYTSDLFNSN